MHPQEEWSHGMQNPLVVLLLFSYVSANVVL